MTALRGLLTGVSLFIGLYLRAKESDIQNFATLYRHEHELLAAIQRLLAGAVSRIEEYQKARGAVWNAEAGQGVEPGAEEVQLAHDLWRLVRSSDNFMDGYIKRKKAALEREGRRN